MFAGFLLAVIAISSFVAAMFFLRFWRVTHDSLFVALAMFFAIQGINSVVAFWAARPNEGNPFTYTIRLLSFLFVWGAIVNKDWHA